jgi:hypothetical protein
MLTHPRDYSPLGWAVRDAVEAQQRAPRRREGLAYFIADAPDAYCPCCRYGSTAADGAPVAWRLAYLIAREQGEPITFDDLDYAMGLVVNDHDDVASIIREHGQSKYQ